MAIRIGNHLIWWNKQGWGVLFNFANCSKRLIGVTRKWGREVSWVWGEKPGSTGK